ncbi:hypothetical protein NBRC10512_004894 [Rhodotorula toruloides]|uniref:RHTO0S01e12200g1_1 n=2 Tax=Rhodotorula toruloides TaxID=5286 RepID=A0A061AL31_RHOTO|nr:uncharacterized protein RHTO_04717 [Rhodotorula toruloides NP11]EMS24538.1 hypothetical protein RHTO_04717 [Rhodotorula toruloides NP11]KAJ8297073.1 hypothetical protein OF846_000322 [Rhodotorula toruloides]CDR36010.1 RHTO0S01e12200g1_1 [Rhodotorula toruloides]
MSDPTPPGYSTAGQTGSVLINLAPPPDSGATFQVGYLGHGQASIEGEVQIKYAGGEEERRPAFSRLEIEFRGVEQDGQAEGIELFDSKKVIWGVGAAGSSSEGDTGSFPPSSIPFKLDLTPDLPKCLHVGTSSLEYTLTTTLYSSNPDVLPILQCSPVHLTRRSPPGSLLASGSAAALVNPPASTSPVTVSAQDPLAFSLRLPRTVFRQSEPIELVTRIEVPDSKRVGAGLRLRTVSAELVRTITVSPATRTSRALEEDEGGNVEDEAGKVVHRTVLAHSGKSARFSPSRPIVIRLVLHPPAEPSCETITQATILHSVDFSVVVTVGLVNISTASSSSGTSASTSSAQPATIDAVLSRNILIVPDTPSGRSDKQKEVIRDLAEDATESSESWRQVEAPVPTYVENSELDDGVPAASGSRWPGESVREDNTRQVPLAYIETGDEEEYDGYEDVSLAATLSDRPPPPRIDDDVSPPSVGEPSSSLGLQIAAAAGDVINEADEGDPLTPPPNDFAAYPLPPPPHSHAPSTRHSSISSPPPLFQSHASPALLEPATPPPHIDFPPLPSLATDDFTSTPYDPPPSEPASPASGDPPPLSPFSQGLQGLPPPYFGSPARTPDAVQGEVSYEAMERGGGGGSLSGGSEASVRDRSVSAEEEAAGRADEDQGRPPPYEQRQEGGYEEGVQMLRYGVNRRGEVVL